MTYWNVRRWSGRSEPVSWIGSTCRWRLWIFWHSKLWQPRPVNPGAKMICSHSAARPIHIETWAGLNSIVSCECWPTVLRPIEGAGRRICFTTGSTTGLKGGAARGWPRSPRAAPSQIPQTTPLWLSRTAPSSDRWMRILRWKAWPAISCYWVIRHGASKGSRRERCGSKTRRGHHPMFHFGEAKRRHERRNCRRK